MISLGEEGDVPGLLTDLPSLRKLTGRTPAWQGKIDSPHAGMRLERPVEISLWGSNYAPIASRCLHNLRILNMKAKEITEAGARPIKSMLCPRGETQSTCKYKGMLNYWTSPIMEWRYGGCT